jgi:nitronate monooxygenase
VLRTALTDLLGITIPVVQAPMGGGPTTAALVASVSEAGGLGSLAGGYLTADDLAAELRAVREATAKPFTVNLFAEQHVAPDPGVVARAQDALEPLRLAVGLPPRAVPGTPAEALDEQLDVVVSDPPAAVSFTFGLPAAGAVGRLHARGCLLIGTATTVEEAVAVEQAGLDIVCAQGSEAGAHRGTFLGEARDALVGTVALVPQVCDAVSVPVVAAGGIMDGRGIAAALALGAAGAQLGTAFLRCPEAGTAPPYRRALAAAGDTSTALTSRVTGRLARGIRNALVEALEGVPVPPYPVMHALTAELRRQAARLDRGDLMSLWCGQGVRMGTELPAGDLVRRLDAEAAAIVARLSRTGTAPGEDR